MLEMDASIPGLGAVLSLKQEDSKLHPIAYASRALNQAEKNYGITELETLAVVWGITHFHSYLYGNRVRVLTDHSAVKAVLETSNPTGKHAHWWTRVYGSGVRAVIIVYHASRENASADALLRSPEVHTVASRKVYNTLMRHWWWQGMFADVLALCKRCPDCAIVTGGGCRYTPTLRVQRPFQKIGDDVMDLPCTERGNRHVVVFQDMLTKWPMVLPVADQKADG